MKECITGLESMLEQNIKMEPQRRRRSQGRLIRLLHDVSGSVYRALRSGLFCTCNHNLHLRLSSPCSTAGRDADDETILQKIEFELALTYTTDSEKPTASATTTCIQQTATATAILSALSSLDVKTVQGTNLCAEIGRNQKQVAFDSYGIVHDQAGKKVRMFGVYPQPITESPDSWSVGSPKDVLANPHKSTPMSTPHRLHLAEVVSSSLLQLHQRPWVLDFLTSRVIVFLKKGPDAEVMYTDIFIARSLPERALESSISK
ncbi:hypothetical protein CTA2_4508 [Colletotrichum tanaceti]|uniref:Uncharacterized protein n=1 Tax=Colletotrichum tanaceti TaxID=1306861 RepID=A0A4U6X386_9PEZI|nr:hypothetical protein CTA2_4508 [Colletotrichum tanaceti]TKW49820.1 hypothetical protein CTA1_10874 [Colletotrichum tanaceti]